MTSTTSQPNIQTTNSSPTTTTNPPTAQSSGLFNGFSYILNSLNSNAGSNSIDTGALSSGLAALDTNATGALNYQNTLNDVLQQETVDLNDRIQNMNGSVDAAKRTLLLNESVRERTQAYNTILYYFIGMLVLVSALSIINRIMPILSSGFFDVILVVIVCVFIILIFNKYVEIANRDIINYEEVALPKPDNVGLTNAQIMALNDKNRRSLAGSGMIFNLPQQSCPQQIVATPADTMMPVTTMALSTTLSPMVQDSGSVNQGSAPTQQATLAQQTMAPTQQTTLPQQTTAPTQQGVIPQITLAQQTTSAPMTTLLTSGFTLMGEAQPNSYYEFSNYSAF